jgi:SAM-dependent methyltransferase
MNSLTQKFAYLGRSLAGLGQVKTCPYCGSRNFREADSKFFGITRLLKCQYCGLQHRHPKDDEQFLKRFYQTDYQVDIDMMTDLPDLKTLEVLRASHFSNLRDYGGVIKAAAPGRSHLQVVDYGCSWGYNVYKLAEAGMRASGYELSVPRAEYGRRHLGVMLVHDDSELPDGNDVFFSSHVIEHLPDLGRFVGFAKAKLKGGGVFIAFCPNGSEEYRKRDFATFHVTWGRLHALYLDIDFAQHLFKDNPYLILTGDWPYDLEVIAAWDGQSQVVAGARDGYELLIIARPNISLESPKYTP